MQGRVCVRVLVALGHWSSADFQGARVRNTVQARCALGPLASADCMGCCSLLKITENNGLFQKENFDIEFFEIQEEKQGTTTIETLRQLKFSATADPETGMDFIDEVIPDEDQAHVEYYLDVLVDNEIGDDILCKFDPVNENQGVYADKRTKLCQDVINQQKKKVFDIYTDESDDPGEIC